jgi:hypothetical protein
MRSLFLPICLTLLIAVFPASGAAQDEGASSSESAETTETTETPAEATPATDETAPSADVQEPVAPAAVVQAETEESESAEEPTAEEAAAATAEEATAATAEEATAATAEEAAIEIPQPAAAPETRAAPARGPAPETPAPSFFVMSMPDSRLQQDPAPIQAIQRAVVASVTAGVTGRSTELLSDVTRLQAIMACEDDACAQTQVEGIEGAGSLIIRTRRAPRRGITVRLELYGAGTTGLVVDPIEATIARDQLEAPAEALAEALASLQGHLPAPPPVSTLLFAVNVDGATIEVDGQASGLSPLAPIDILRGRRFITIRREGFETHSRAVNIGLGERVRVNVDLVPEAGTELIASPTGTYAIASGETPTPWYQNWYIMGGIGAGVVLTAVIIGVAASGDSVTPDPNGFSIPPLER